MTDQRPQYGELATPEEQRRAAGLPPSVEVAPVPPTASAESPAEPVKAAPRRSRADRIITIALLAYGLVNVITTGLAYLDLPSVMDDNMRLLGIDGEFTNFAQGRLWGAIAAMVLVAGWAITAAVSIRRLRRGRLSWWVPLVGAVATILVVSICIAVPMAGDPAFIGYMEQMAG